jgi:hypothetical protein
MPQGRSNTWTRLRNLAEAPRLDERGWHRFVALSITGSSRVAQTTWPKRHVVAGGRGIVSFQSRMPVETPSHDNNQRSPISLVVHVFAPLCVRVA